MLGTALLLLDPWLRRTLEKQVAERTHGQYSLQISALHTSLWHRSVALRGVTLRPAAHLADTLPRITLALARLDLQGVGLWAVLRKKIMPVDSLGLDSLRLELQAARKPKPDSTLPLHQRLPFGLPGIRLGHLSLQHCQATLGPAAAPLARWKRSDITARDLLLSAAGAADGQRLGYAGAWQLRLRQGQARAGHHRFAVDALNFSTAARSLRIDSLRIHPPAPGQGTPGALRVRLNLLRLQLTGWNAAAVQHKRHFQADSLALQTPTLTFWPPTRQPPPLWQLLSSVLKRSDLAHLHITNGYLRAAGLAHDPQARAVNITSTGIRIDSLASADMQRIAYAHSWLANTGRLTGNFDVPYYRATIQHMQANTNARELRFTGLSLTPTLSTAEINRRKGYQASQVTVRLPALVLRDVNYPLLAHKSRIYVGRLLAPRPWLQVASDGRGPITSSRSVLTPEAIRRIPIPLTVNRVDIENGTILAHYRSPRSPLVGHIRISRFNGTFHNFTNNPARQATPLTATATAYLQDRCRFKVSLRAPLNDPQGRHRIWGNFGTAPFAILNSMTAPTKFVRFDRGDVRRIGFQMDVNQQEINGTMQAEYTGLKLSLLKYKDGELKKPLLAKIGSGLANKLVIRDDNPRPSGRLVTGTTRSRRELRSSVVTLWRQGLISGLLHSVGLPQPLAQKISQKPDAAPLPGKGDK